ADYQKCNESHILKIVSDKWQLRYLGNPPRVISEAKGVDVKKQVPGTHNPELQCEIFLLES
ncbi:unnamed protein product, partial [marine sediment metagenome]